MSVHYINIHSCLVKLFQDAKTVAATLIVHPIAPLLPPPQRPWSTRHFIERKEEVLKQESARTSVLPGSLPNIIHHSFIIHRLIFFHPTSAFFPSKECETLSPNILSSLGVWLLLLLHTPRPMSQKYSSNEAKCSKIPLLSTKLNTICIVFSIKFHWKSKKKSAKSDKYQENEEGSRVKNVCRWGVERFAGAVVPTTNHRHRYPS